MSITEEKSVSTRNKAYIQALKLLAYKPRTVKELSGRLETRGFSENEISRALEKLSTLGYINDEEYALRWAECAVRDKHYASFRIELELRKRGIDRETARRAAAQAVAEKGEELLAREIIIGKIGCDGFPEDKRAERRLMAYLLRRGFSRGVSMTALKECKKRNNP